MDQALLDIMNAGMPADAGEDAEQAGNIRVIDPQTGEVEVETPHGVKRYILKPVADLFGAGNRDEPRNPENEHFMPLLLGIEESILTWYKHDPDLADGRVGLVLSRLAIKPGCDPAGDILCACVQARLRLILSLNDYSREEVRWALHTIERSVARHTRTDGPQGYLEFINHMLP
jgi:hypothetical protein